MPKTKNICRFNRSKSWQIMKLNLALICKLIRRILKEKSVQQEWANFFLIPVLSRLFQIHYKSDSFSKEWVVIKTLKSL
jgi:hypothetical protein